MPRRGRLGDDEMGSNDAMRHLGQVHLDFLMYFYSLMDICIHLG